MRELTIQEQEELLDIINGLQMSVENYFSSRKPETEWDEYDYMMFPKWIRLQDFLEKIK